MGVGSAHIYKEYFRFYIIFELKLRHVPFCVIGVNGMFMGVFARIQMVHTPDAYSRST